MNYLCPNSKLRLLFADGPSQGFNFFVALIFANSQSKLKLLERQLVNYNNFLV